jgi:hypothetical protein
VIGCVDVSHDQSITEQSRIWQSQASEAVGLRCGEREPLPWPLHGMADAASLLGFAHCPALHSVPKIGPRIVHPCLDSLPSPLAWLARR